MIASVQLSFSQMHFDGSLRPLAEPMRTTKEITLDGRLDEIDWQRAQPLTAFLNKWPLDSGNAALQTEVRVLFNDQFLYVAAVNYQKKEDLIIQTLKRDQLPSFWGSDGFSVVLDPIHQKANGFLFGVNAGGAQLDAAINAQGSWTRANENWDNKWYSATSVGDSSWIAELAIPFSALRFKEGVSQWGVNFIRNDMKNNAYSTWAKVPLQFNGFDLAHTGILQWPANFYPDKSRLTLIPYASGSLLANPEEGEDTKLVAAVGLDAKVAVSSSLNLDLTIHPDFSNVEVDRQMTNVTRFSLFFPERRNFFLENADLFTNFGSWQVMPFFSRKIGMQDGVQVPILAGARLSGNLTNGLRVGIMDIQTRPTDEVSANNYFVSSLQQRVLARSVVKFFAASRQTTTVIEGDPQTDFNRTYGGEFQYVSSSGRSSIAARAHTAFTPEKLTDHSYFSLQANKNTKKYYAGLMLEQVGENYVNDFGFVPRLYNYDAARDTTIRIGHYNVNPWLGFLIYPKKSALLNMIEPNSWSIINYRSDGRFLERNTSLNVLFSFKSTSEIYAEAFQTDVCLPFATDILGNDSPLPVGRYRFTNYKIRYSSDTRKQVSMTASIGGGAFYNGSRKEYGLTVNLRRQPWGTFGISYLQNVIDLPQPFGGANFLLIGPRSEVSITSNLWWTTFFQYNTQAKNVNVNSRLQWRFKPMSDFFIVYTDNYTDTQFNLKNRGIVCKLTCWLNI